MCVSLQRARNYILERLMNRLQNVLEHRPLDMERLDFICTQDMVLLSALSDSLDGPDNVMRTLTDLCILAREAKENHHMEVQVHLQASRTGRPRIDIDPEYLKYLLDIPLSVTDISRFLGVSRSSIHRRMSENNISVSALYSHISDPELDVLVTDIKKTMPNCGYRMVKGALLSQGHMVQWERVRASLHRVDTIGVLERLSSLRCVVRRSYSVPCPKSLMHIDTNHKLIR